MLCSILARTRHAREYRGSGAEECGYFVTVASGSDSPQPYSLLARTRHAREYHGSGAEGYGYFFEKLGCRVRYLAQTRHTQEKKNGPLERRQSKS